MLERQKTMARQLDSDLFYNIYQAWKNAPHRLRGRVIESAVTLFGLDKATIYRKLKEFEKGKDLSRICGETKQTRTSRLPSSELDLRLVEIKIIAAEKFSNLSGKNPIPLPTERAIQICQNRGSLSMEWSLSTANRWLNTIGCSARQMNTPTASLTWREPYSNSTHMVDASVLNRYYLNPSKRIKRRSFFDIKDEETAMNKDKLVKVWIYSLVDVYSKSFFLKAYGGDPINPNSKHRGENSTDYIDFFKYCWLEKDDCRMPVNGVPEYLYTDKGSGLTSLESMLRRLGIEFRTHAPGNAKAKGAVERRIGIFKNSVEPALDGIEFQDIAELNDFLHRFCIHQNQLSGKYDLWMSGTKLKPIRRVTEEGFWDATVSFDSRVVDAYGCVSVNNKKYAVANDLGGQKVTLFKNREGQIVAEDSQGNLYVCDSSGARGIANATGYTIQNPSDAFNKTEREYTREEIKKEAKNHRKIRTIEDILPNEDKLVYFPVQSIPVETVASIAPEEFNTVEAAWSFIERRHSTKRELLPYKIVSEIDNYFTLKLQAKGFIPNSDVYEMSNHINKLTNQLLQQEN